MTVKEELAARLEKHEPGKDQVVELPTRLVVAALAGKPVGAVQDQAVLLDAVKGLKPADVSYQPADLWFVILGEL
jgi:hypothetical protein